MNIKIWKVGSSLPFIFIKNVRKYSRNRLIFFSVSCLLAFLVFLSIYMRESWRVGYQLKTQNILRILGDRRTDRVLLNGENTTLFQPSHICNMKYGEYPGIILVINSSPSNLEMREAQRKILKNQIKNLKNYWQRIEMIFFIGLSENPELNNLVQAEVQLKKDIVLENFEESYQNLTIKTLRVLKWVASNCQNVPHLLKMDDDIFFCVICRSWD